MKNKSYNIFACLIICLLLGCSEKGTITIKNFNRDSTFRLSIKYTTATPTGVRLKIIGFAEDTCNLEGFLILPKGEIDTSFFYDYYNSKEFVLRYNKYKSENTTLKIDYYFPGY